MIFIVVKFDVKPEYETTWLDIVAPFTAAVREEPGNLWFDWSVSVDDPRQFVLVEAFADDEAGSAHVRAPHFAQALKDMKPALARTPRIISQSVPQQDWDAMGELEVGSD